MLWSAMSLNWRDLGASSSSDTPLISVTTEKRNRPKDEDSDRAQSSKRKSTRTKASTLPPEENSLLMDEVKNVERALEGTKDGKREKRTDGHEVNLERGKQIISFDGTT